MVEESKIVLTVKASRGGGNQAEEAVEQLPMPVIASEDSSLKENTFRSVARRNSLIEANRETLLRQKCRRSSLSNTSVPSASDLYGDPGEARAGGAKRRRSSLADSIAIGYTVGSSFESKVPSDYGYGDSSPSLASPPRPTSEEEDFSRPNKRQARSKVIRRCSVTKYSLETTIKAKQFMGHSFK